MPAPIASLTDFYRARDVRVTGGASHHTILDLVDSIFSQLGWRPGTIKKELDKPVGVLSRAADNTKCRELLGWEPAWSIADGVRRTVEWYSANLDPVRQARLEDLLLERS